MFKTLEDAELFYDGRIPQHVLDAIRNATPAQEPLSAEAQATLEAKIDEQIDYAMDMMRARKLSIARAVVDAADRGDRGVYIGRDWHSTSARYVAEARATIAGLG